MSTDKLLVAVAEAARKDDIEEDPRWGALVEGRISEADRKALEALAARDARHEETLRMLAPLSEEARDRMTDRILSEVQAGPQPRLLPRRRPRALASSRFPGGGGGRLSPPPWPSRRALSC
jgi:ferric-dicitrate binding protein FerR (iron transport regulator)